MDEEKKSVFRKAEEERRQAYRDRIAEKRQQHSDLGETYRNQEENERQAYKERFEDSDELDIKDLAESSIEDENTSMSDLDGYNQPQIDFGSTDVELEESIEDAEDEDEDYSEEQKETESEQEMPDMSPMNSDEILEDDDQPENMSEYRESDETEEQEISAVEAESEQEMPDMSPMSEALIEEEQDPENNFSVDEVTIDFQATEQNYTLQEEAYDLGETLAEKTEVAIIDTVAVNRLTDIRKEFEVAGLQPPVEGPRPASERLSESKGIMARSPQDFDADKFPPNMGTGTPPASNAFYSVRGQPNIKIGNNPYGYA